MSDPQLRAAYNKYGKDNDLAPEGGFADPQEYFQQMFGGDAFRGEDILLFFNEKTPENINTQMRN